jgi:sugar transferase (PEP-CTERM/EpsH1 system associated)
MRVLHLVHAFQTGGAEGVVLNLVRNASPGVENHVCSFTGPNDLAPRIADTGAEFRCLEKKPGNDPAVVRAIARLIGERDFDLVHSQGWGTYLEGLIAAKVLARRRPRFIFAFHGKSLAEAREGVPVRQRAAQWCAHWLTDACIAPAQHMAADYAGAVGIPRHRIRVIPNGIDTARFRPSPDRSLRAQWGFDARDFVVGFVGRLDPVKDIRGLVVTFARLRSSLPRLPRGRVRLLVIGDGEERASASRLVVEHGLGDAVVFAGMRADVPRCLGAMDVYLQPSHYEGQSLTLLEAMASELPVISTAVGGTPEIVRNGRTGFLVAAGGYEEMAATLLALAKDAALRRAIGTAAREDVVRRFSLTAMVGSYEQLYRELLGIGERPCAA